MSKNILLIVGVLAVANVVYSFVGNNETATIFGFELNIWVYRLIWTLMAFVILFDYFRKKKTTT